MENIGKVKIEGKTLTEYLQDTFNSSDYQSLQEGDVDFDGGKEIYIKKIFKGFKDMAYYQMLEKYPKTRERIEAAQIEKYGFYNRKKGDETEQINVLLPQ